MPGAPAALVLYLLPPVGLMGYLKQGSRLTPVSAGRVLQFPVRTDPLGQIELFPEPEAPDPHSASQLVIHYTLLQMRVTRISSYLSPRERLDLFGQYHALLLAFVEPMERRVANWKLLEAQSQIARIA